eukprot:scaffold4649_cov117-Skeletonema_dohrnii-CCMP3373.AAC.1
MAKHIGSLEAVDCHIHSVRYDMVVSRGACGRLRWPHHSSGHLRRCSDADTSNKCLSPVDCHIHSVRYDMTVNKELAAVSNGLIRPPTTL